jgi:RecJ-like exonuclease
MLDDDESKCGRCKGTGFCPECDGKGAVGHYNPKPCKDCDYHGDGYCSACHGKGKLRIGSHPSAPFTAEK